MEKLKPLNFESLNTDEAQDLFCDGDKCEINVAPHLPEQQEVLRHPARDQGPREREGSRRLGKVESIAAACIRARRDDAR
jgi:hypothetical protein